MPDSAQHEPSEQARAIAARIVAARRGANLSAAELSRRCAVGSHSMWRYENARVTPGTAILARIAQHTGVSLEWLAMGDDAPATPAPDPERAA